MSAGNRVVFIGNIPYGVTEELIQETLSRVGQVVHFRLVYDKDTGKPKGFGFAEYADADAAASAVRNLNDHELMGRKLRVDYSNDGARDDGAIPPGYHPTAPTPLPTSNGQDAGPPQPSVMIPPLPPGTDLGNHLTAQDAISATVSTISPLQLLDAMRQMQALAKEDPDKAAELLKQGPQLTYAILQILVLMQLVDPQTLAAVLQQAAQQSARPQPVPQAYPPPQPYQQYPPPQPYASVPTPPVQPVYHAPPPAPAPPPAAAPLSREALIQQVMSMSQESIDALPPADRVQIMTLRQSLMQQYQR
ncbi:hypothetical protein EJ06DRAFT_507452 [Trichodelitschia bisporula]|uniref:RRM domain-containing protein n=1 Tax=Trichodelitschia bisporula TaxID=703511 RepID=A0A6G1I2X1_9PEZI|nr:hypothetical protein EJ06DRAFT_507452 [Trichodelitschia bisporula]